MRRGHARAKQHAHITKDVDDCKDGPVKVSMDYMYLHERKGPYQDEKVNPPHMVMVEHKFGRGWAYIEYQTKGYIVRPVGCRNDYCRI